MFRFLPLESSTAAKLSPAAQWGTTEYLLASLLDATKAGVWQRGGGKGRKPEPVPRPSDPEPVRVLQGDVMAPADLTARLRELQRQPDE